MRGNLSIGTGAALTGIRLIGKDDKNYTNGQHGYFVIQQGTIKRKETSPDLEMLYYIQLTGLPGLTGPVGLTWTCFID